MRVFVVSVMVTEKSGGDEKVLSVRETHEFTSQERAEEFAEKLREVCGKTMWVDK
jgi:hypothetical protein